MKRFFVVLATVVAMVGCSKMQEHQIDNITGGELSLVASIEECDTRVAISGDKMTSVSWEVGDVVKLWSDAGVSADITAQSSGIKDVHFTGKGNAKSEVDTYYALYPKTAVTYSIATFNGDTVNVNYTSQLGSVDSDVAMLAGRAINVSQYAIDMTFKPINALMYVSTTGVDTITKAEFMALDGSAFASGFSYNYTTDTTTLSDDKVTVITVNNPATEFFFALPADLDMSDGYLVRLTNSKGETCSKAYAGKSFARGTTSRIAFEWTVPAVTLGAKSSYSYYTSGDVSSANKCVNTKIYFSAGVNGESCLSSYSNVQDVMVEDLGFHIGDTDYSYSSGKVTWNKADNTFSMKEDPAYTATTWGEQRDVYAFIVVEGKRYASNNYLWITGLPHVNNWFNSDERAGWSTTGTAPFDSGYGFCTFYYYLGQNSKKTGEIYSPSFVLPSKVNVHYDIKACYYTSGVAEKPIDLITGITMGTSKPSTTQTKTLSRVTSNMTPKESKYTLCQFDTVLDNGQRVYITDDHQMDSNWAENWFSIGSCVINYR